GLKRGEIPIFERGLEDIVERNMKGGRLSFTADTEAAVASADVVMLAVGTPTRRGDGLADVSFVMEAAADVARALRNGAVVVTKSTLPVGTRDEVEALVRKERPCLAFSGAS